MNENSESCLQRIENLERFHETLKLFSIIPKLDSILNLVQYPLENFITAKLEVMENIINSNSDLITPEMMEQSEYYSRAISVFRTILKLNSNHKIVFYLNLLSNSLKEKIDDDVFDDLVGRLDSLSFNEIYFLHLLSTYEEKYKIGHTAELKDVNEYWEEFKKEYLLKTNIPMNMFDDIGRRLVYSGFYMRLDIGYVHGSGDNIPGITTPSFKQFSNLVIAKYKFN